MEVDLLAVLIFFSPSLNQKLITLTELRPLITRFGPTISGNFLVDNIKEKNLLFNRFLGASKSTFYVFSPALCVYVCVYVIIKAK